MDARQILWACFVFRGSLAKGPYWFVIGIAFVLMAVGVTAANSGHDSFRLMAMVGLLIALAGSAKRCHALGYTGALSALMLVPGVNLIFVLWLGLKNPKT